MIIRSKEPHDLSRDPRHADSRDKIAFSLSFFPHAGARAVEELFSALAS